MSVKIRVSYTEESEADSVLQLLKPILGRFKVNKSKGTPPYKHLYFTPKNGVKAR
jgi:hypothetical protein